MDNGGKDLRPWKIFNMLVLVLLVLIAGLLVSMNLKLNQVLTQALPQVSAIPSTDPATLAAQAGATPSATGTSLSTVPAARRVSLPPTAKSHYMQSEAITPTPKPSLLARAPYPEVEYSPPPPPLPPPSRNPISPALAASEPEFQQWTVPAGAIVTIRLIDRLDSEQNRVGDRFTAALDEPISSNGHIVAPRGTTVEGRVVTTRQAGRVSGLSELSLELDRLQLDRGQPLTLVTDTLTRQGEASRGKDAVKVGAGSAIGAAIGAIAGGRRGAGIGAATGAGAGTAGVLLTRGKPVILIPETRLSFQLRAPLQVEMRPGESVSLYDSSEAGSAAGRLEEGRPRLRRRGEP